MTLDLDQLLSVGAIALKDSLDGRPVDGLPHDFELRFWDPEVQVGHRQQFIGGRLATWTAEPDSAATVPDLVCSADQVSVLLGLSGKGPTLETFRLRDGETGAVMAPPPFDVTTAVALDAMPEVPDVTASLGSTSQTRHLVRTM